MITAPQIILLSGFSDSLNEYVSKFTTPVTSARAVILKTLIDTLKNNGNWYILDALNLYASEAEDHGHVNLINPNYPISSVVDAPVFTIDRGYQMDGVNDAINSNFILPRYRKNYQLNSASAFVWSRTSGQSNNTDLGGIYGADIIIIRCRTISNLITGRINDVITDSSTTTHTDGTGLKMINRPDSATKNFYNNGSKLGADIARASSSIIASQVISPYYGADQIGSFGVRQIAAAGFGGGHTDAQALSLYNALATYMTAVGA